MRHINLQLEHFSGYHKKGWESVIFFPRNFFHSGFFWPLEILSLSEPTCCFVFYILKALEALGFSNAAYA